MRFWVIASIIILSLSAQLANAASNGSKRANSTSGWVKISAKYAPQMKISGLHDVDLKFTEADRQFGLSAVLHPCIFHSTPYGRYQVTFTSAHSEKEDFYLANENNDKMQYQVYYKPYYDTSTSYAGDMMRSGVPSFNLYTAYNSQDPNRCENIYDLSTVDLYIGTAASLQSTPVAGTYKDTLTIQVDAK